VQLTLSLLAPATHGAKQRPAAAAAAAAGGGGPLPAGGAAR
jgi:hypothetical protein